MYRRSLILIFILVLVPLIVYAGRPSFGVEGELFFPKGDWANGLDRNFFYKFSVQKNIISFLSGGFSIGSTSFTRTYEREVKLSMFPVVYIDIIGEKRIGKSPLYPGIFLGLNFSRERITFGEGSETASIWGWSTGGYLSLKPKFIVKPFFKARYISRKDTDGLELSLGIQI